MRVVIVGNGVAGMEAALVLRQREPTAQITIVSEESDHFFSRTALMWVWSGQLSYRDIEPLDRETYERMGFTRVRARAMGVDTAQRKLLLAGGLAPLPYDRLLLACGSKPRPAPWPGADCAGVGHFVTLQDLEWLERETLGSPKQLPERAHAHREASAPGSPYSVRTVAAERRGQLAQRPVVIGGGLIGIEAVEVLLAAGKKPTFLIREEWFWPMAIDARESAFVVARLADHGVDVRLEHEIEGFSAGAQGALEAIRTKQGLVPADLCVVAIGVVPNTDWLRESGIKLAPGGGIEVNRNLATSADGVFAAGDCAAVPTSNGSYRPEQLWYTSRAQGRIAARSMLGDPVSYVRGTPYNSAKLMDLEYTTAGSFDPARSAPAEWFFEEKGKVRSTLRIALSGESVVGVNALGRRWDHSVFMRWIEERRPLSYALTHLTEASFDTEFVPKLVIPAADRARAPNVLGA